MKIDGYIACICEGNAETAIMDLLLENNKLCFRRQQLIDEKFLRCRKAKDFEKAYLRKEYGEPITVLRILDSRRERFKLSKPYEGKVSVINVITAPEIEILVILSESKYDDFKRKRIKPSEYCKTYLEYPDVKTYKFVNTYFNDVDKLIAAIEEYKRVTQMHSGESLLFDLLETK